MSLGTCLNVILESKRISAEVLFDCKPFPFIMPHGRCFGLVWSCSMEEDCLVRIANHILFLGCSVVEIPQVRFFLHIVGVIGYCSDLGI